MRYRGDSTLPRSEVVGTFVRVAVAVSGAFVPCSMIHMRQYDRRKGPQGFFVTMKDRSHVCTLALLPAY